MDIRDIRQIMNDFSDSALTKMNLEWDGVTLQMEKESVCLQKTEERTMSIAAKPSETKKALAEPAGTEVKSPVVGVFYKAASPQAAPFVTLGQQVEKGQVLCIVEAMKMMNEITAPVSGTLTSILVEQEEAVEYGQVLMRIR